MQFPEQSEISCQQGVVVHHAYYEWRCMIKCHIHMTILYMNYQRNIQLIIRDLVGRAVTKLKITIKYYNNNNRISNGHWSILLQRKNSIV